MSSLGVKLPLSLDSGDGFTMIKDLKSLIKQNLKMLLLTNPGERVMEPLFGVGINQYLFENFAPNTYAVIDSKIREQVSIYMPMIAIAAVSFDDSDEDRNKLAIRLEYSIPIINIKDLLEFTI